ncbi:MAG: hypothetical protein JSW59_20280 [Phycisphaerales bacterium]|nr:MAG: hypothetical protein JSW59_20280 [Phycisphaerales bacterium]
MAKNTDRTMLPTMPAFVLALLCTATVSPVLAGGELSPTPAPLQKITWSIGAEIYNFKYEESIMDEEGVFYGFNLGCAWRPWATDVQTDSPPDGGPMFGFEGRAAFGQVDYDGALDDGTPLTVNNIDDYALEVRGIIGMDQLAGEAIHNVYVGIGYRYLNDDLAVHPAGYERESNYLYLPIGFQLGVGLEEGWSWGARLEYDIFLWGEQRSHLRQADPTLPNIRNDQDEGFGYRASVRIQHKHSDGILIIEPFFRFWDIEDSEVSLGWLEPANETTEYGIQFIWMF